MLSGWTECRMFLRELKEHIDSTRATTSKNGKYNARIETAEYIDAHFNFDDFALSNVIKYATRYPKTKNPLDLLKAAHYLGMVYERDMCEVLEEVKGGD